MRKLNVKEEYIFNSVYKIYYQLFEKDSQVDDSLDTINISSYNNSWWKILYGNDYHGFAFFNNIYLDYDKDNLTIDDIGLIAHEFVHVIQFRHSSFYTTIRFIFERFYYGKDAYCTKGTLEYEAMVIQLFIVNNLIGD